MAFDNEKFAKLTSGDSNAAPMIYGYMDTATDNLATIMGSGYFNDFINELKVNDIMFLRGSDDEAIVKVTSVTTNVTVTEYSVAAIADGSVTNAKVNASAAIAWSKMAALTDTHILVGNGSNVAVDVAMSGDVAIANTGATTIQAGAVEKSMLAAGIKPSHMIVYAGKENNGGGSATIAITVTGTVAGDIVMAQVEASTNAVNVQKVTPTADTVTVLLSADPGASTVIGYQVIRATS